MRRLLPLLLFFAAVFLCPPTRTAAGEPTTVRWAPGPVLDQGMREACTGYGLAGWLSAGPDAAVPPGGSSIWMAARWATGQHGGDGGAVVGVALAWLQHQGYVATWDATVTWPVARRWLLTDGPILLQANWTTGMDAPAAGGVITPTGTVRAAHVFYCYAATASGVECRNSWGAHWADHGDFWLSDASMAQLFRDDWGVAWRIVKSDAWRHYQKGSHRE